MGLLSEYRSSLKPLDVEEPIDVYLHRPLGFLVAKASFSTPVSPDLLTLTSILFGLASGVSLVWSYRWHMQVGGALLFFSAVLDCADGQLARMRKSSSAFGRMLDGLADLLTTSFVVPATLWVLWRMYDTPMWLGSTVVLLAGLTIVTSSFHTTSYDHFKNVYLRMTSPTFKEGEDYATALGRWQTERAGLALWKRVGWRVYLFYTRSQSEYAVKFDPTSGDLQSLPPYSQHRADVYRRHVGAAMRVWRTMFGFGTMVFGLALFIALERPDVYMLIRLVIFNAVFFGYLRPLQRAASRRAFEEMGRSPEEKEAS